MSACLLYFGCHLPPHLLQCNDVVLEYNMVISDPLVDLELNIMTSFPSQEKQKFDIMITAPSHCIVDLYYSSVYIA